MTTTASKLFHVLGEMRFEANRTGRPVRREVNGRAVVVFPPKRAIR